MKVRQVSNTKNKICLFVGLGMLFISGISILLNVFNEKRKWPSRSVDLYFLLLGVVGGLLIIIGIVNIVCNIEINRYLKNPAYGLDYQKENSTYAIIGKDKKKAKNGALRFHKYSEWKEYVEKSFNDIVNNEDAYRFMLRRLRSREKYKELIISAVIPVEVGILTALYSAGIALPKLSTIIAIFISAIILLVIVTVNYLECEEEIEFISDFNEIVFPSKSH